MVWMFCSGVMVVWAACAELVTSAALPSCFSMAEVTELTLVMESTLTTAEVMSFGSLASFWTVASGMIT